mmetsp:Transcript_55488/g.132611  ORF Transcript_55488/g.132611 Transcript_55488/m.132611 type:complete len:329 (-) Transcript_55488:701-1687(-)
MIRNLDVSEGLVGCCLASPELWTGEQVVQGLRVGGSCSHHRRLAQPEILRRIVTHLGPGICGDHCLSKLWIGSKGDLARSHELGFDVIKPGAAHAQDVASLIRDLAIAVWIAVQPASMQHNRAIRGRLELGCRVTLCTHHQLGKGVATMALAVLLQKSQSFILHLWASIALDEGAFKLAFFVLEDQCLHGCPGVVVPHLSNVPGPHSRFLVQVFWHEHRDVCVVEANLDHLLQGGVEPHEAATISNCFAINLQLDLVETPISLCVHTLFKVDTISTIHLCDNLLHSPSDLMGLVRVMQMGSSLSSASMNRLDQALLREVHGKYLLDKF